MEVMPPTGMLMGLAVSVTVKGKPGVKVTGVVPEAMPAVAVTVAVLAKLPEVSVAVAKPLLVGHVGGAVVPRLVVKVTTVPSVTWLLYLSTTVAVTMDVLPPTGMLGGTASRATVKGRPGVKVTVVVPEMASTVAVTVAVPMISPEVKAAVAMPPVVVLVIVLARKKSPRLVAKVTTVPSVTKLAY
jgi:hypothetical protein